MSAIAILLCWPDWRGSLASRIFRRLLALDELALEDVEHRRGPVVGARGDLDRLVALPLDGGAGALEVEARGDLPCGLSECVVDLLAVDLADDVERRVGHVCPPARLSGGGHGIFTSDVVLRYCFALLSPGQAGSAHGRLPERPMGADCKSVGVFLRRFESCTCHSSMIADPRLRRGSVRSRPDVEVESTLAAKPDRCEDLRKALRPTIVRCAVDGVVASGRAEHRWSAPPSRCSGSTKLWSLRRVTWRRQVVTCTYSERGVRDRLTLGILDRDE